MSRRKGLDSEIDQHFPVLVYQGPSDGHLEPYIQECKLIKRLVRWLYLVVRSQQTSWDKYSGF